MEFKSPYSLSRNYTELHALLIEGYEIPCFVDYSYLDNKERVYRDICRVRRRAEFDISFGARGIGYGDISSWRKENGKREIDCFVDLCKMLNVEFIEV